MRNPRHAHMPYQGYTRKEMVMLFVGFLIFLSGVPGRSETWILTARTTARHLVYLVLVFLGLVTPITPIAPKPHMRIHRAPAPVAKADPNSMMLRTLPLLHHYTYHFEGKATFHGKACPNASVLVRLTSGERSIAHGTVTEADGSYSMKVGIDAADNASVDWTLEAYDADFNTVELSGRQIVRREDMEKQDPITVTTPVDFVVSLSK